MMYQYWFANASKLSKAIRIELMETYGNAQTIYHMLEEYLKKHARIKDADKQTILEARRAWNLEAEYNKFLESGISFTTLEQEDYPLRLREISNAPYAVYYIGRLPSQERRAVAIVGARGRSSYGNEIARRLAYELAQNQVEVISGLAMGIDTDAHSGALEGGGDTFAVLGGGVDICYPRQNAFLYEQIAKQGGILSEFPIHTQPIARQFPSRNRIISGLSEAVVVVEAKYKSGSLITADFAMEQGREVYAVPGRISDPLSQGCNHLIYQGAGIVQSIEQFMEDFLSIKVSNPIQMDFRKNLLEKRESLVYSLLDFCPIGLGTLVEQSSMSLAELLPIIEHLIQLGYAKETVPNFFTRRL